MVWWLEMGLYLLLVGVAIFAISVRDLVAAAAGLTMYSLLAAALLTAMGAVDVGLTEAALGAGITGVLLIGGISHIGRRSPD